jgi:hypothetical protein
MSNYVIGVRLPYLDQVDAAAEVNAAAAEVPGITVKAGNSSLVLVDANPEAIQNLEKKLDATKFIVEREIRYRLAARPFSSSLT